MPNTEVKLTNAESTWPEAAREDRKLLINMKKDTQRSVFFCCVNDDVLCTGRGFMDNIFQK